MVLENKIDRFISKIEMGKSFFEDAALMLVQMIDEEPGICDRIVELRRVDWLTRDVLHTFEAIGRKQLAVEAMFLPRHVIARMLSYPVEQQAQIATQPVRVLNGAAHRKTDISVKHVRDLTRREADRVFGPNGVRSPEEQNIETPAEPDHLIGYYELTVLNGKPFLKKCDSAGLKTAAQRVKLDQNRAMLKIVS